MQLDRTRGRLAEQLADNLRRAIQDGRLRPGIRLASTRVLAGELGVARTVCVDAYARLTAEGYLRSEVGSGTYVELLKFDNEPLYAAETHRRHYKVTPTSLPVVSVSQFQKEWAKSWRHVARLTPPNFYLEARGELELRDAIASYLRRSRGITCTPEQIVVTSGTVQSMDLLLRTMTNPQASVGVEEPSDPALTATIRFSRQIVAARVDVNGLCVKDLPVGSNAPKLVYVTPSRQYPLGHRMALSRRLELIEWAFKHGSLVLEDDYDSEFRFDGSPLPTLYSLAPACVVYLGTVSKVLTPTVRCGYIVATNEVASRIARVKEDIDGPVSWPAQMALAFLISDGGLERHIRRMRHTYARVRTALDQGLSGLGASAEVTGFRGGLNVVVRPRANNEIEDIVEVLNQAGLDVQSLANYFHTNPTDPYGILVRYGALTETEAMKTGQIIRKTIVERAKTNTMT